jgi:hypothetical protein
VVTDTSGVPRTFSFESRDGTTYRVEPDPPLAEGESIDISIRLNGIEATQRFRRIGESEVGEITGTVVSGADTAGFVIELYANEMAAPLRSIALAEAGSFMFDGLPKGIIGSEPSWTVAAMDNGMADPRHLFVRPHRCGG